MSDNLRTMIGKGSENLLEPSIATLSPRAPVCDLPPKELPLGLQRLMRNDRLSDETIYLAKATLNNPCIDLRHGNPDATTALSIELTEYIEWTISKGYTSLADGILLMALHRQLYDLGAAERFSRLYQDVVLHWTRECLAIIDKIDSDDEALVELFIWACFKHGGTMVAPFLRMESDDPNDLRMQLMIKVLDRFWQVKEWFTCEQVLLRFSPMTECIEWWHMIWLRTRELYDSSN